MTKKPQKSHIKSTPSHITDCPLKESHDKLLEAHYFIGRMMREYHEPLPFKWNLNAFLQALRSVTFFLQSELSYVKGFKEWYSHEQEEMKRDDLLRTFVVGRNIVVKERNLIISSTVQVGLFKYRRSKLAIQLSISPTIPSRYILEKMAPKLGLLDKEHSAIGEEYGVLRIWKADELGKGEVLETCEDALVKIAGAISRAHKFMKWSWPVPPKGSHNAQLCGLLTETDLNPSLINEWGWE